MTLGDGVIGSFWFMTLGDGEFFALYGAKSVAETEDWVIFETVAERKKRMEERRSIGRVEYPANSVIVVCSTGEKYYVKTDNVSPLGMGITAPEETPEILGQDIIIVAETLIMYADVKRQVKNDDGKWTLGIEAKKFTPEVLEYLFSHIN